MPDKRKYSDRAGYLIKAVAKRRKTMRQKVVEAKGGKCIFCDYDRCSEALDLHHLEAKDKEFGLSARGLTRSWAKIMAEAEKCILVCANCHREIHDGFLQPSWETKK